MTVLKVSAQSDPKSVADALAAVVREQGSAAEIEIDGQEKIALHFHVEPR